MKPSANKRSPVVRSTIGRLVYAPLAYLLTSYLYWAVLKAVGVLLVGNFHYQDNVSLVHGGAPFWLVVVFGPLTFPFHLMESIDTMPTVAFIQEYRYGFNDPPHALLIVLLSAAISTAVSALAVLAVTRLLRYLAGSRNR